MFEQLLALGVPLLVGGVIVLFFLDLLVAWASAALVDISPGIARLSAYVLAGMALTAGVFYLAYLPLTAFVDDWQRSADSGRFSWSLLLFLVGLLMACGLVVYTALTWPILATTARQSVLIGLFTVLLRALLWSLILGGIFVFLGFSQGLRGTPNRGTTSSQAPLPLAASLDRA